MKKIYIILVLISTTFLFGQQDSQFTQYMYNMSIINPAYATSDFNNLNTGLLHRQQWLGIEGSPKNTTFFAHYAADDYNELGVSLFNDNIGDGVLKENKFSVDYAHIINIDDYSKLSFGIKAGFNMLNINFNGFELESGDQYSDDLFANNENLFFPNVGAGVFYFTKNSYLGFSVPNILKTKYLKKQDNIYSTSAEEMHYFLTGGYVFDFYRSDILYKPSFMVKGLPGGKPSVDLSMNVLFNEVFEIGLSHRLNNSISGLVGYQITENLKIGYSYDYILSNLTRFTSGSHEIIFLYDFNLFGTNQKSPRFF